MPRNPRNSRNTSYPREPRKPRNPRNTRKPRIPRYILETLETLETLEDLESQELPSTQKPLPFPTNLRHNTMKPFRKAELTLAAFALTLGAKAQQAEVNAKVIDERGQPIEFVTVALKNAQGGYVQGCLTEADGFFRIKADKGTYVLHLSHIGHNSLQQDISLEEGEKRTLPNIVLRDITDTLHEITVQSKRPLIRRELDRIVFNAERLNVAAVNFLDVLQSTPGVLVSDDGISMVGKGSVLFLMNGREMKMSGKELVVYLRSLPANSLQSVEVMTTPPAKYSAAGDAGIINLVVKKRPSDYLGATLTDVLSIKERGYNDASASLQFNKGKLQSQLVLGLGTGNSYYDWKTAVEYPTERWQTDYTRVKSNRYRDGILYLDYDFTKDITLGGMAYYMNLDPSADLVSDTRAVDNNGNLTKHYITSNFANRRLKQFNSNIHFDHKNIGKGGTLAIDADYINYKVNDHEELLTTGGENMQYLKHPSCNIDIYSGKADVELPFTKGRTTFGCAFSHTRTDSRLVYERQNIGANLDDHFIFKENVAAAYADITYRLNDKISAKAGLRGEFAHTDGLAVTGERTKKNRLDLFPTAYFSYAWNEESVLSASFSGRIQRPNYSDINSFVEHVDAHNITTGNPTLLPEKSYTAEIGYTYKNFSITGSGRLRNNVIDDFIEIDNATKMVRSTNTNMLRNNSYSLGATYNFDSCPWFDSYLDIYLFHIDSKPLKGINLARTHKTAGMFYLNNNIYFNRSKTFLCNWWAQYNTAEKNASDAADAWYRLDLNLKWLLFNKRLAIGGEMMSLIASHRRVHSVSNGATRTVDYPPFRVFKLSFTYSFGQKLKDNSRTRSNAALQDRLP